MGGGLATRSLVRAPWQGNNIDTPDLAARIAAHLRVLAGDIGSRPPGSDANRRATEYLRTRCREAGIGVDEQPFRARVWTPGEGTLETPSGAVAVRPNPYSAACDVRGPAVRLHDPDALPPTVAPGSVVLLEGALTREPLFPKRFPFLTLPEQQALISYLEAQAPAAVVAVVASDRAVVPVFEDADVAFPSTTVAVDAVAGVASGDEIGVRLSGSVAEGPGVNLAAGRRRGPRVVVSAHVDTKVGTPGAFDNAGSVAAILALAESRAGLREAVEYVFFNGEDHYAAPGEQAWLAATDLGDVTMNINVDGAGYAGRGSTAVALACPEPVGQRLAEMLHERAGWSVAEPWFESDHAIFAMRGIPSVAVTCEDVHDLLATVAHSASDTVDKVDVAALADVAAFLDAWLDLVVPGGPLARTER